MKISQLTPALVVPILVASLAGCASGGPDAAAGDRSTSSGALPVRVAHADLSSGVQSLAGLAATADLAVIAKASHATQAANSADPTIVATSQHFTVQQTLWGAPPVDDLVAKFTGGVVRSGAGAPYELQLDGQPQFATGATYLLFLLGPAADGTYMVIGGPQGRYQVQDGAVSAVSGTAATSTVIAALDGRPLGAVTSTLRSLR